MELTPYLFLDGRCEEAIKFYETALGAKVGMMMRFKDHPDPQPGMNAPGDADKIMHANITIDGRSIMLSDGRCTGKPTFQGFALSLTADTNADAEKLFKAVSADGQVQMPMASTFFASRFGMATDKFGVSWMVATGSAKSS